MTETSNQNPDQNQHITDYLEYYINQEEPADSAILLTGSWGCGKTYYIDRFIENYKNIIKKQSPKLSPYALQAIAPISYTPIIQEYLNQKEYKTAPMILKISLFGLKSITELDKSILLERFALSNTNFTKVDKFFLFLSKSSLQFTDAFFTKNTFKQIGLNFINFMKSTTLSKQAQQIILIFDDLERTDIPLKELLGHINAFIERDHLKIILIANEDELTQEFIQQEQTEKKEISEAKAHISEDDLKNRETYKKFKEKVVGKTFEVQSDFDNTLAYFIQNNPYKEILLAHVFILKEIYSSQKNINLRQLKQELEDFAYLLDSLKEAHKQHTDFLQALTHAFFGLKLALHNKELSTESFKMLISLQREINYDPQFLVALSSPQSKQSQKAQKRQELEKEFQQIYQNYHIQTPVYSQDVWYDILVTNNLYNIQVTTDKLIYFILEEKPLWLQCYDFFSLDQNSFTKLSQELIKSFESLEDENYYEYLHVIGLLIEWSNQKLISKTIDEITVTAQRFLNKHSPNWTNQYSKQWENFQHHPTDFDFNNWTNRGFHSTNDPYFQKIEKLFQQKQQEAVQTIQQEKEEERQETVLNYMKDNDYLKLRDFLVYSLTTQWEPIFHQIGQERFLKTLFKLNNKQLINFNRILQSRYLNNNTLNEKTIPFYMVPEFIFWIDIKIKIDAYLNQKQQSLKSIQDCNFEQLLETIQKIINAIQPFFIVQSLKQQSYHDLEVYLCNKAQQIAFDKNINTEFKMFFWEQTTTKIEMLASILMKRYENLLDIQIIQTEFAFWNDILNYLQLDERFKDFIQPVQKIIQKIEETIKNKKN